MASGCQGESSGRNLGGSGKVSYGEDDLEGCIWNFENALAILKEALETAEAEGGPYFYLKQLKQDEEILNGFAEAESFGECCQLFETFEKPRLNGRRKKTDVIDPKLQERCKG